MTLSDRSSIETNNLPQDYLQSNHHVSALELDRMHALLDLLEEETRLQQSAQSSRIMDNIIQLRKQMTSMYSVDPSTSQSHQNSFTKAGDQLNRYWDFP